MRRPSRAPAALGTLVDFSVNICSVCSSNIEGITTDNDNNTMIISASAPLFFQFAYWLILGCHNLYQRGFGEILGISRHVDVGASRSAVPLFGCV